MSYLIYGKKAKCEFSNNWAMQKNNEFEVDRVARNIIKEHWEAAKNDS